MFPWNLGGGREQSAPCRIVLRLPCRAYYIHTRTPPDMVCWNSPDHFLPVCRYEHAESASPCLAFSPYKHERWSILQFVYYQWKKKKNKAEKGYLFVPSHPYVSSGGGLGRFPCFRCKQDRKRHSSTLLPCVLETTTSLVNIIVPRPWWRGGYLCRLQMTLPLWSLLDDGKEGRGAVYLKEMTLPFISESGRRA